MFAAAASHFAQNLYARNLLFAGLCKYEVHEDDVEFEPAKQEWDSLPDPDKERYALSLEVLNLESAEKRTCVRRLLYRVDD